MLILNSWPAGLWPKSEYILSNTQMMAVLGSYCLIDLLSSFSIIEHGVLKSVSIITLFFSLNSADFSSAFWDSVIGSCMFIKIVSHHMNCH